MALSQARNGRSTDADVVYLIRADGTNTCKIGVSNEPMQRRQSIQLMSPLPLALLATHPGSYPLEDALHRHFAPYHSHGEWFTFPEYVDPVETVQTAVTLLEFVGDDIQSWPAAPMYQDESTLDGWLHGRMLRTFKARYFTFADVAEAIKAPLAFVETYGMKLVEKGLLLLHPQRPGVFGTRWSDDDRWALPGGL
ncbi:GIY-YIG nuclease family protein [Streptomyces sp. NPDC058297]|uniref:GIY-YIG nuclease family protein n=1 Tax=Streptomyces sp. NPDC058297 TaxID=3346433 RepID=UPI0036DFBB8E